MDRKILRPIWTTHIQMYHYREREGETNERETNQVKQFTTVVNQAAAYEVY